MEKWGLGQAKHQRPPTRAVSNHAVLLVPTKVHEITIRQDSLPYQITVTGAPLSLEFAEIFPP